MKAAICIIIFLQVLTAWALPPQTAAKGSIEGAVVRAGTGEPIPGARVSLTRTGTGGSETARTASVAREAASLLASGNSSSGLTAVADSLGKFVFRDLDPGSYHVSARANGYARQEYGQQTPAGPGKPVNLISGRSVTDIGIPLTPAGNVTGRVHDNSGQPAVGIQVQLLMATYNANGQKSFQSAGVARTDDRGEYRLFWITPGRYYLLAANGSSAINGTTIGSPNEANGDAIAPTFYPGTAEIAQASIINIKPGSEIGGADIFVNRQTAYRVRGRVIDGRTGQVPHGVNITLTTASPTGATSATNFNQSYNAQDGSFELRDVSPGPHILRAQTMSSSSAVTPATSGAVSAAAAGSLALNVTSDMDGVVLSVAGVVPILGQITMDGPMPSGMTGLNRLRVQLRPSNDGVLSAAVGGPAPVSQPSTVDGAFRIDTVLPGEYRLSVSGLPEDVYVKQARFNQTDVLNNPMQFSAADNGALNVVLSSRGGQVEGSVIDGKQHPVSGIQAVLVPDHARDRADLYKTGATDANGQFRIQGIAPGDYRVFAWEAMEPFAYFDADRIEQSEEKGTPVHIAESSSATIDVPMIPAE